MTFPHDMLLECNKTSFTVCDDVAIRFTKNSANGFSRYCSVLMCSTKIEKENSLFLNLLRQQEEGLGSKF